MRNKKIITGSHPHPAVAACNCLSWQVEAVLSTSFNDAPMYFEMGQPMVIYNQRNYVFWSEYDTGGVGGNERGIVVTVDVPSGNFPASSILSEVPLDLGRLSFICGVQHVGYFILLINGSDGATLTVIDADADHDNPVLASQTTLTLCDVDGADGLIFTDTSTIPAINYYAAADHGIELYDLTTFGVTTPTFTGSYSDVTVTIRGVGYQNYSPGKIVFASGIKDWGDGNFGAVIAYDVGTPATPTQVGILKTARMGVIRCSICPYGNYLYALTYNGFTNQISIFDITDPTAMSFLGLVETSPGVPYAGAQDLIIRGTCMWGLTFGNYWQSFDLANPAHPVPCTSGGIAGSVGSTTQGFNIGGLQMVGGTQESPCRIIILGPV